MDSSLYTDRFIMELATQRKPHLKLLLISHEFMGVTWNSQRKYLHFVTALIKQLCGQELLVCTHEDDQFIFKLLMHNEASINGGLVQK